MTELQKTFRTLYDAYPGWVVGGRSGIYTFRTRVSNDLHLDFGIPFETQRADDGRSPLSEYRFACPREEALKLYRAGRRNLPQERPGQSGRADTPKSEPDAKQTVPFKPTPPIKAYMGSLGRRSGEVRRVNPKYVLCPDGKYRPRSKSKIEAKEKQSTLPLEAG